MQSFVSIFAKNQEKIKSLEQNYKNAKPDRKHKFQEPKFHSEMGYYKD